MELSLIKDALEGLRGTRDSRKLREVLSLIVREVPKKAEYLSYFEEGFALLQGIEAHHERGDAAIEFAKSIPPFDVFLPLYMKAAEAAISSADLIDEHQKRITELIRIANELPKTKDFLQMRVQAWRLAAGLPDKPRNQEPNLQKLAKELPKANDYAFYRRYTLMGVAKEMPREGPFMDVYRDSIRLAMSAAQYAEEPYYRKYALMYIANEIATVPGFFPLYKQCFDDAYKAAQAMKDPFAKQNAFLEVLRDVPKTEDFYPLIQEVLSEALGFFTVRQWMEDVEVFDVVDYILSAEETGLHESKQKRFDREKYANAFAKEVERFGAELNDTRFIETLRPFTHVWIQPRKLRDSVKKVVDSLESLKDTYHGREIERPVFIKEAYLPGKLRDAVKRAAPVPDECVAIDLGATNTVIMRKRAGAEPEFVILGQASRKYDNTYVIPTILSPDTNRIGGEVVDDRPIANIKQMLLEGNPKGKVFMEKFFRLLSQAMRKSAQSGWLATIFSRGLADVLYITVPVGYVDYKNAIKEIVERTFRGLKTEFIEEPLAAAVGYQVVEDREKVCMVIDFGGSTLNTMIVRLDVNEVHVVSKPERAQMLGGHDIDIWLAEHLASRIGLPEGELPFRLVARAEEIKIALSTSSEVPFEWNGREVARVTREEFESILDRHDFYKFIDRFILYVIKRGEKVGLKKERIEAVLLTGGSSQIPSFKEKIGHIFPNLRAQNLIYDHSPLTAVGTGAALYGTREIVDRHLGMAYAIRYATKEKETSHSYSILLEKGEHLPLEKTFRLTPARKLGAQTEVSLEIFEVPESLVSRRWVREEEVEFLKQELTQARDAALKGLKTVTLPFREPVKEDVFITLHVSEDGMLSVRYGPEARTLDTGIRLQ